ncbi:hypothetical protein HK414_05285 [Ramlibacter terrae]|uniref:DUF5076 domain-containing protein n=1 Tax=Ramlibacter terrae TaxID=2732511 RepID=A0ABX6P0V2_9BURK|nr:hypothetical protein HK414_05285 [Ramlibacter terrae]
MNFLHTPAPASAATPGADPSLEACDEDPQLRDTPRYCPTGSLASFALLMAGHGRCVNTDMMLGDREYAMWQLACARAMDDRELSALAVRLFAYFDDPQHSAMPVLGTA